MILLLMFLPLLFLNSRTRSLTFFLSLIIICSLLGTSLLGRNSEIEIKNIYHLFLIFLSGLILFFHVAPWSGFHNIIEISYSFDKKKLARLTKFLLVVNSFIFIIFLLTTIIVQNTFENINEFKYTPGEAAHFFTNSLPFPRQFYTFSKLFYGISYFLIPLHFYYISQKKYLLSFLCFLLSTNIILHGATYFSRASLIEYLLLYCSMFWLLNRLMPIKFKRFLLLFILLPILYLIVISFIDITNNRFENNSYYDLYLTTSSIKNPAIYSIFDYMSQWYINGYSVLSDYDFETFNGKITFKSVNDLFNQYGFNFFSNDGYINQRSRLWKANATTFVGLPTYYFYDYGIFLALVVSIVYYKIIKRLTPKSGFVSLNNLFFIVLLVLLPIMGIFYSKMGDLVFPIIFCVIINIYLKYRIQF